MSKSNDYDNLLAEIGNPKIKRLPVNLLDVDPDVQRVSPSKRAIRDIADNLAKAALGVLAVSVRRDGFHHVIDGQRRRAALMMLGEAGYRIPCAVWEGLTKAQEADLFRLLNTQRVVSAFDNFDKGLKAGDPICLGIAKVCKTHGWTVTRQAREGTITCVRALSRVWQRDENGGLLDATLSVLTSAFGHDRYAVSAYLVEGVGFFLAANDVKPEKIIQKMTAAFTPLRLIQHAKLRRQDEHGTVASNVSVVLERLYKKRLKKA